MNLCSFSVSDGGVLKFQADAGGNIIRVPDNADTDRWFTELLLQIHSLHLNGRAKKSILRDGEVIHADVGCGGFSLSRNKRDWRNLRKQANIARDHTDVSSHPLHPLLVKYGAEAPFGDVQPFAYPSCDYSYPETVFPEHAQTLTDIWGSYWYAVLNSEAEACTTVLSCQRILEDFGLSFSFKNMKLVIRERQTARFYADWESPLKPVFWLVLDLFVKTLCFKGRQTTGLILLTGMGAGVYAGVPHVLLKHFPNLTLILAD